MYGRDRNYLNQLHDEKNITKLHNMYENTCILTNDLYIFLLLLTSETFPHSTSILLATIYLSHAADALLGSSVTQGKSLNFLLN